jgi:PadR family transcriptional regulator PadR
MAPTKADLLQGTLDMLVLRAVADESLHGYGLLQRLRLTSGGRILVPQGSLYPALHRLENQGMLKAEWKTTASGREAKIYSITARGRRHLATQVKQWRELSIAIGLILGPA